MEKEVRTQDKKINLIERRCSHLSCNNTFTCNKDSRKLYCDKCIRKARQKGIETVHIKLICNLIVHRKERCKHE
jgi:hypothetical protein